VAHEEQLQWEARWARPATAASIAAAVLLVVSYVFQAMALNDRPDGDRGTLIAIHEHENDLWIGVVCQAVALVLLAGILYYLFRASRYRRAEMPAVIGPLVALGPVLLAAAQVISQIDGIDLATRFYEGPRSETRAEDLLDDRNALAIGFGSAGQLAVAFAFVFVSLSAMRVGLLSRFLGILGIIIGALTILPLFPGGASVIQIFWLGALAAVFMNWLPNRGPAWQSGVAEPWPTAAELREQRHGLADDGGGEDEEPDESEPRPKRKSRKRRRR
jgi:hypothetical protein